MFVQNILGLGRFDMTIEVGQRRDVINLARGSAQIKLLPGADLKNYLEET